MFHSGLEMNPVLTGNGNGSNGHLTHAKKKAAPAPLVTSPSGEKECFVTFQTTEGVKLRGALSRVTRHLAVFELYNPGITPRSSEVLNKFTVVMQSRAVYSGRAVVSSVLDAGTKVVGEVILDETGWADLDVGLLFKQDGQLAREFKTFLREWQKLYVLSPEFKLVVADMQIFLNDLRLWVDHLELGIRNYQEPLRSALEKKAVENLSKPVSESIDSFIDRFESIVTRFDAEAHSQHYAHLRRQLHPFVLSSPFASRAFTKPLGYAGDYQVVDMMIRPPCEGATLFGRIINVWLWGQSPAQAHRNRVDYLEQKLFAETARTKAAGRTNRVLNLGCGPAEEVRRFFEKQNISQHAALTLVDFNEETLQYLRGKLEGIKNILARPVSFRLITRSVFQILKDGGRCLRETPAEQYDYIYCAGLFDYLSDKVCSQILNLFYDMLAPDGLLLATNATDALNSSRPFRYSMEYLLDWHLIYRDKARFAALSPDSADHDKISVIAENTGANLFLEIRKPKNA
jgi:extracellular factor (EF) 3-hydroxypalmitic acid methyl ester biosynthesis protein